MAKLWMSTDNDNEFTEAQIMELERYIELDIKLMNCEPLADRFPPTSIQIQSNHPPNDYFNTGGMFVVSEPLKAVLEQFHVNAEFFLLDVFYDGSACSSTDFYFAHLLDERECFDFNNGECTFHTKPGFTDRIRTIRRLAVDDTKMGNCHLIRMAKCSDDVIVASDDLAESVVATGASGVRFVQPEMWTQCY